MKKTFYCKKCGTRMIKTKIMGSTWYCPHCGEGHTEVDKIE